MSSYYYLMAQLPFLSETSAPAISYKDFLSLAERCLSADDLKTLSSLSLVPPKDEGKGTGSVVIDSWNRHERALRFSLARARASKQKRDTQVASAGTRLDSTSASEAIAANYSAAAAAKSAAEMESPLEAELYLDKIRFSLAKDLGTGHFYDSEAVFAYALMLLVRERSSAFSAEAGKAEYMRIYDSILEVRDSDS